MNDKKAKSTQRAKPLTLIGTTKVNNHVSAVRFVELGGMKIDSIHVHVLKPENIPPGLELGIYVQKCDGEADQNESYINKQKDDEAKAKIKESHFESDATDQKESEGSCEGS